MRVGPYIHRYAAFSGLHLGSFVIDTVGHHFSHRQFFFLDELAKAHPCAAIVVQFIVAKEAEVNYISGRNLLLISCFSSSSGRIMAGSLIYKVLLLRYSNGEMP